MDIRPSLKSMSLKELLAVQKFLAEEIKSRQSEPKKIRALRTYTDGASRGNPGLAGIGVLIYDDKDGKILQEAQFIGVCTNNEAEYRALMLALDLAYELTHGKVECFLDSELVVRQMNGQYAIKSEKMRQFADEVKAKAARFESVSFTHVPREHPKLQLADKLANRGIDEANK